MAPSPSPEPRPDPLEVHELETLVDIADDVLAAVLAGRPDERRVVGRVPEALRARRGAFVTLTVDGELNGCIGDVAGNQPLHEAVARLALSAAFDDPRLPPLHPHQYERLTIEVSVLTPFEPVVAGDRAELVALLQPHVDGVVIRAGYCSGLFLPGVWSQLPDPDLFLDQLWRKAGLPTSVWPETIDRFTTQHLSRATNGHARHRRGRRGSAPISRFPRPAPSSRRGPAPAWPVGSRTAR
ncbi:MAG TPA: AmmeMemoRadiSam system protein A [Ilumatobacter sp.]|nr:AmmeMemoRadiSam system protein A [Ilumatobacter sp.]